MNYNKSKIEELFYQLEFANVKEKQSIIQEISNQIPWELSPLEIIDQLSDPSLRVYTRALIPAIKLSQVTHYLKNFVNTTNYSNYEELEQGVFLISSIVDVHSSYKDFKSKLDAISFRVKELYELNKTILNDNTKIILLSRVLFEEEGYIGNTKDYSNPDNSFITVVLKNKLGIPITLSIIYLLVGHRLNLPLFGINLPLHFMIHYETPNNEILIDPYNGGIQIDKETCRDFLKSHGFGDRDYFVRTSTITILKRIINNLIKSYNKSKNKEMEIIFKRIQSIFQSKNE